MCNRQLHLKLSVRSHIVIDLTGQLAEYLCNLPALIHLAALLSSCDILPARLGVFSKDVSAIVLQAQPLLLFRIFDAAHTVTPS